jgi:hypothetical protein
MSTLLFIAVLFTQPAPGRHWIVCQWCISIVECHSASKKIELLPFAMSGWTWRTLCKGRISQRQKKKCVSFACGIKLRHAEVRAQQWLPGAGPGRGLGGLGERMQVSRCVRCSSLES